MRRLLLALPLVTLPLTANALLVTSFTQTSNSNTVNATDDTATTTITITNALVNLGGGLIVGNGLDFNLTAVSIDPATSVGGALIQHYNGSFSITSGPGGTGVDFLSGSFTDAAFGAGGGPGLVVNVNNPPDTLTLASDVVPASELQSPSNLNLTFTNLLPALHEDGTTIGAFTASFTGDVSASAVETVEPSSLAMFGVGLLGMVYLRRRSWM